ncbi:MAG: class I SAM-dependent methyltransferase [Hyphomicrobiales bacterium]|nr:class I SAM-dependent methyltransferase [Hyphomicrobiales bacterium]
MAKAQPIRALANYLESFWKSEDSDVFKSDKSRIMNTAFLNAQYLPAEVFDIPEFREKLVCEQTFRPLFLDLKQAELRVVPQLLPCSEAVSNIQQYDFSVCLILAGKFKALNEHMIDRAHMMTKAGGSIIVAGEKNNGIGSLQKRAARSGRITSSISKYHSVVFELESIGGFANTIITPQRKVYSDGRTYITASGLFSSDGPDDGSRLLAGHFDDKIQGSVADLGAGWGYLSAELIFRSNNIASLDLYEADWNGINISRQNLTSISKNVETGFNWHDVVFEVISKRYNWVIMNPPFHTGRDTSTKLGQNFIQSASSILKPRGKLLMVANRHLAYEATLAKYFSSFRVLEYRDGFKILSAQK